MSCHLRAPCEVPDIILKRCVESLAFNAAGERDTFTGEQGSGLDTSWMYARILVAVETAESPSVTIIVTSAPSSVGRLRQSTWIADPVRRPLTGCSQDSCGLVT